MLSNKTESGCQMSIEVYQTELQSVKDEIKELDFCIERTETDLSETDEGEYKDYLTQLLGDQFRAKERLTNSLETYMQYA